MAQYSEAVSGSSRRRGRVVGYALVGTLLTGSLFLVQPAIAGAKRPYASTTTTTTTTSPTTTTTVVGTTTSTTTPSTTTSTTTTTIPVPTTLAWPANETAAVAIPSLHIFATSPTQPMVPIASITKLMTTWVVLHHFPLQFGQRGPCHVVNATDMAGYRYDVATDQSNVRLVQGMTLCEGTLLRGLLVHSAGDYAHLLVELTGWSNATFIRVMNRDARVLGLRSSRYVEVTGIDSGDVSTASDQVTLAVDLMNAEPIVRDIVALPSVDLPGAGLVDSYTPFVGEGGVVGVKSGFTGAAGGCDVMAINFVVGGASVTAYAVVLGDHGTNPIVGSGVQALALARSLRPYLRWGATAQGHAIVWTGTSRDVRAASYAPMIS